MILEGTKRELKIWIYQLTRLLKKLSRQTYRGQPEFIPDVRGWMEEVDEELSVSSGRWNDGRSKLAYRKN